MQERRNRALEWLAEIAPPMFRERILPTLENHVLPILSHFPRPIFTAVGLYVLLQVMIAESGTVRAAWARAKYHAPQPVHDAVVAVGMTSVGDAVWGATLAIRATSGRVFHPLREVHARQEQRGSAAGEGLMKIKQVMDGVDAPPANAQTTIDDVMKELEASTPAAQRR